MFISSSLNEAHGEYVTVTSPVQRQRGVQGYAFACRVGRRAGSPQDLLDLRYEALARDSLCFWLT